MLVPDLGGAFLRRPAGPLRHRHVDLVSLRRDSLDDSVDAGDDRQPVRPAVGDGAAGAGADQLDVRAAKGETVCDGPYLASCQKGIDSLLISAIVVMLL